MACADKYENDCVACYLHSDQPYLQKIEMEKNKNNIAKGNCVAACNPGYYAEIKDEREGVCKKCNY